MITVPAFKAHLRVVPVPGEGILLLSENATFALRGREYEQVVPLIDGRRSADEIVGALAGAVEPAMAWFILMRLEKAGHIAEHAPDTDPSAAAFWLAHGIEPSAAAAAFSSASVRIFASCLPLGERLGAALSRFGIAAPTVESIEAADPHGSRSDLDIVLTDDYLSDTLLVFDEAARAERRRWLLVRPAGVEIWIGPMLDPGRTACLHCLRYRLGQRRPAWEFAAHHDPSGGARVPLGSVSPAAEAACLLAATEVARSLADREQDLTGVLLSVGLRERSSRTHRLVRYPGCPVCGEGPVQNAVPLRLRRRRLVYEADGGHRTMPPEDMLGAYEHLVSPILGVVGSLTRNPGAEGVGRTYGADDTMMGPSNSLREIRRRFRRTSGGKGITDVQARASALGEVLERYSLRFQGTELRIPGTFRELGEEAVHPNRVALYSERQYRARVAWTARHTDRRHYVPERFDPEARVDWTPIWSMTERRHKLLPTEQLYYGPVSGPDNTRDRGFFLGCSNGCASGSTLEEAVLQGFFELVERDAVAIWWYNRLRRPAVDLASFDDRWLSDLALHYEALDREVVALDLTSDLGIPVFAGLSHRRHGEQERILLGLGCHLDARIALQRALTEMSQMLSFELAGKASLDKELGNGWLTWATRENQPYLAPDDTAPARVRDDIPSAGHPDLLDSIEFCRKKVEALGMEMLVLDQTRTDVGMPVVKVVVPGLRHFWARFAPGRLYDVPVALGWRRTPMAEEDLNPVPVFW